MEYNGISLEMIDLVTRKISGQADYHKNTEPVASCEGTIGKKFCKFGTNISVPQTMIYCPICTYALIWSRGAKKRKRRGVY